MTKEVMVTLSGLQLGDSGEDTVETVHIGEYYEKNGVHYLFFDELLEGHKTPIRNMLKLRNEKLEVRKRGPVSAELVFEEGEVTESAYNIPYGSFLVGVHTKGVCLVPSSSRNIRYFSLSLHPSHEARSSSLLWKK